MKVLIVDDEPRMAATLSMGLRAEGAVVAVATDGAEALHQAVENRFDAIILDIMMPGLNGYEVLRQLRARGIWSPVLILSAKDGEFDQTDALDLGADDYLVKPYSFTILLARLRALMRRGAPERPVILTAGSLSVDPGRRTVTRDSTPIDLTSREFCLLEFLIRHKDTVVTKSEILQNVWDLHYSGPHNVVEVYVSYLRRKIDAPFGTDSIATVRGAGYRLDSTPGPARMDTPSRSG